MNQTITNEPSQSSIDNYITATLGVYLSLYNGFQSLFFLLGNAGGRDE